MNISQCTLALVAMCLVQAPMDASDWHVDVTSPVRALQGMSATFNCSFGHPSKNILSSDITAIWLEYPCENTSPKLYNNDRSTNGGVTFIGNLETKNCSLQINVVRKDHEKTYCFRFKIRNKDSWTGKPGVKLIVHARPTKPTISLSSELVEGVNAKLSCSSSEIDEQVKFSLVWHGLNGKILKEHPLISKNRKLNSILDFIPSFRDHNKSIKCSVVSSEYSFEDETQRVLKVKYAPKNITIQVNGASQWEVKEYDRVSLTCASNSNPEATYTWYKRDKSFNTNYGTLLFESISQSDSGSYSCTAKNYLGNQSSEVVEIRVQYAPKNVRIQVKDRSQLKIKEGDKVSLTCVSNSNPKATNTWYKRDEGKVKVFNSTNGTLLFQSISQSASGFYSCRATNYLGNQSSEAVEIRVQYAPKNVRIQVKDRSQLKIKEGDKVSLTCVSNSNPKATNTWYKRDEGKVKVFNSTNGTLLFQSISQSASGFYSCRATNYLGNESSEAVEIRVQYAPKNITIRVEGGSKMGIKEGDNVSLVCTSQSYPDATHSWYKRKEDDDQIMALISTRETLLLYSISRRDSGLYICTASNYLGNKTSEDWNISVYYKPTQINLTQDGMSFHCITEANPPATISWNSTDTATEVYNDTWTISTLILQTKTSGCVSCQAQNRLGFINSGEQCLKSTQSTLLSTVIAGSIAAILLLLAILLWTQKDKIRGKKLESDSQRVIHTEMTNLPEINQTGNSDVVYGNLCMSKSGERKWKFSRKHSGDALLYASLRFPYDYKVRKAARSNSMQAKPSDAQVTASADGALYGNIPLFKTISTESRAASHDPEETTVYACIKEDNLKGQTASKIKP